MDEILDYYQGYYDKHQEGSYTMERCRNTSRVLQLKSWIVGKLKKGATILDIGCGDGFLSKTLPDYDWHGLDINLDKVDKSAIKGVQHDISKSPYPYSSKYFDAVVCSEVLEHVWDLQVVNFEVRRILKPDGYYFMSTPNFDFIDYQLSDYRALLFDRTKPHLFEHIRQYNFEVHTHYLKEAGFSVIEEYTGADAHYSVFFLEARQVLFKAMLDCGAATSIEESDLLLGKMFKKYSHTIMIAAIRVFLATCFA